MTISGATTVLLEALGVEKRFGATAVLQGANLRIGPGEIHALLGGNGAGKSTLLRIVLGVLRADAGRVRAAWPEAMARRAIAAVFQELALFPALTVAENIWLPQRRRGLGLLHGDAADRMAEAALATIDPGLAATILHRPLGSLDLHRRQLVEIARALGSGAKLLLLDEPTANLTFGESERLFEVLRRLARDRGISTLFVSHRMHEIRAVADVCTILRDGRSVVDRQALATFDDAAIVAAMGQARAAEPARPGRPARTSQANPAALVLTLTHRAQTIELPAGAILGLAGAPDGPVALIAGLIGAAPSRPWAFTLDAAPLRPRNPAAAVRAGVAYVAGDRAEKGILATLPILDNLVAGFRVGRRRRFVRAEELRYAADALRLLSIKVASVDDLPQTLSGGTQQKLLLARWLDTAPRILVLEEPTRGVDIGTKCHIYDIIRRMAAAGAIVVWWSTEFAELVEVCDQILAFDLHGAPAGVFRQEQANDHALARATGMAA